MAVLVLQAVTVSQDLPPQADSALELFLTHVAKIANAISVRIVSNVASETVFSAHGSEADVGDHGQIAGRLAACEVQIPIGPALQRTASMVVCFASPKERRKGEHLIASLAAIVSQFLQVRDEAGLYYSSGRAALLATEYDDCGIIALDHDGQLLFANASAQRLLRAGDAVQLSRGTIRPTRYLEAVRFRTMLECLSSAPPTPGQRRSGNIMLIPRDGGGRPLLAVLAVPREDERDDVGVIVRLIDPEICGEGLESICRLFGLSPVEGRVTRHLVNGLALADAAAVLRIKPDTARAYLKQIFLKTGTHRQGELVALLAGYRRAVASDIELAVA